MEMESQHFVAHAQPEDIQDLLHKLLKDLQIIREELAEYIDCPSWNFPMIDDDDDEHTIQYRLYQERSFKAITPDLSTEEPDNSLSMGDEHLDTIPETESDETDLMESIANRDTFDVYSPRLTLSCESSPLNSAHIAPIPP
ncbi:hypothetical protein Tco_0698302 [Tanacetum coccineum]